jgi:hypothetical protein
MGKKSAPPPPDYKAAAVASGESSKAVTEQQTWANRPDQYTPWGSETWSNEQVWDPATRQYLNKWTQNTNLTPEAQAALDSQLRLQMGRSQLGESLYDRMAEEYSTPMDWNSLPAWGQTPQYQSAGNLNLMGGVNTSGMQGIDMTEGAELQYSPEQLRQRAEDAMYSRATSRLDPQWENAQADKEAQLAAQGLRQGDEAYDRAMREFNMAKTDAYNQATWGATDAGRAEAGQLYNQQLQGGQFDLANQQQQYQNQMALREQQFTEAAKQRGMTNEEAQSEWEARRKQYDAQFAQQLQGSNYQNTMRQAQLAEAMQQRGFSLNEINALLTNQQVGMPSMPNFQGANAAQPVDYMGAAQNQYSGALDQYSAKQAGQQGLMSGLGTAASLFMMSDRRVKKDIKPLGKLGRFNLYEFSYIWGEKAIGVMADEVKKILPEAVIRHSSGYDMVDYTKVLKEV